MVAAVATDEPQIAAKPAHAAIVDSASPPRNGPSQALPARKSSRDMPELVATTPIRMKKLTRERLKSVMTEMGEAASRLSAGPMPRRAPKPNTPTRPMAMPIGTRSADIANRTMKPVSAIQSPLAMFDLRYFAGLGVFEIAAPRGR